MNEQLSKIKNALVTGASSGIGLQYCDELAKAGVNLIIVARDEARLQALAKKLVDKYAIKVLIIRQDLSAADAAQTIYRQTTSKNICVDLLINNAGYADKDDFLNSTNSDHVKMINSMLTAIVSLCYLYLPNMLANKNGHIINVGSIAGLMGFSKSKHAKRTMYSPIKSFVISFTEQLAKAYKARGVVFQCICPGLTFSEFHLRSGESELYDSLPKLMWMSSEKVVNKSLAALFEPRKVVVVVGLFNKFVILIWRVSHIF